MATRTKKPRRTAERILDTTLELFNRFGEPNVSTTLISAELGISPGNLYYHYPAKEELITKLYDRYDEALTELLRAADDVADVEDAWLFFHMLFELIWSYRFLYRDLNDLLSNNRKLETPLPVRPAAQDARRAGRARRHRRRQRPDDRGARRRAGGDGDGRRPHLLAELRVRPRPAPGARARERRARRCCAAPSTC